MQIQNIRRTGSIGNAIPSHKSDVNDDVSFLGQLSGSPKSENNFDSLGPHAPMNVKSAWNKAAEQTGVNGMGIGKNGMMTHIPAALIIQAEQSYQSGNRDVFGNSVDSAKSAAQKILDRLDNPIVPETNSRIRDLQDKEKMFYNAFIKNLDELGGAAYSLWKSQM